MEPPEPASGSADGHAHGGPSDRHASGGPSGSKNSDSVPEEPASGSADGHAHGGPSEGHACGGGSGSKKRERSLTPLHATSERKVARKRGPGARSDFDLQNSYAGAMVQAHVFNSGPGGSKFNDTIMGQIDLLNMGLQEHALFQCGATRPSKLIRLGKRLGPSPHKEDQWMWDPDSKPVTKPILLFLLFFVGSMTLPS